MEAKKLKRKIILMQILSFILSIAPLVVTVACKWNDYVRVPSDAIKLTIGGIIVLVLIFFKAIGKLKMPQKRVILYLFLLLMCYLLTTILADATFLIAMATLGEIADMCICQHFIKKWKDQYQIEKNADATTAKMKKEMESMFDKFLGGGGRS